MSIEEPHTSGPPCPAPGLSNAEAQARADAGQSNAVNLPTSRPLSEIIKANIFTRFNALLGALWVLVLTTGSYLDGMFGLALIVNSAFGIGQEWHAKRKLDSLAVLHAPTAVVVREGVAQEIPAGHVVLGDVVELRPGDQIPADGVLLAANNLEIDESNLTGEADAVDKQVPAEIFAGTAVVAGQGWFETTAVGAESSANKLSAAARRFTRAYSDVQASTNRLLRYLTWVVVLALPISLWSQWAANGNHNWKSVILRSTAGLVGLVPEGLVVLTTLAFLLAALQLTRHQALVQELPAIEGLARVSIICLDKTGTLTGGDITYQGFECLDPNCGEATISQILGALSHEDNANRTAQALANALPDPGWARVKEVPFTSARKWQGVDFGAHGSWLIGAPEVLVPNLTGPLQARLELLTQDGKRLLLLARAPHLPVSNQQDSSLPATNGQGYSLPPDLQPTALVLLAEELRPDAKQTIEFFQAQGVQIRIISGDNPQTVAALARQAGLEAATGVDARQLPHSIPQPSPADAGSPLTAVGHKKAPPPPPNPEMAQLAQTLEDNLVFGRVTPAQKQLFVQALQSRGHTVAMTGDGVNDVLALKEADIGVAMGNAAPATKAVAQIVLLDSRFANMPRILAEGRRLIGNVERVATLFVTKNVLSLVAILATALFGATFPFLPRQFTLLSTLTIGIPAALLALGPNRRRYRPGFLRRVLALAIPSGLAAGIVSFTNYRLMAALAADERAAGTAALISLLVVNFWLLFALARPWRGWKLGVCFSMLGLMILAFAIPEARWFFALQLDTSMILPSLLLGIPGAIAVELAYRRATYLAQQAELAPNPLGTHD